jgi:hypothetical protein
MMPNRVDTIQNRRARRIVATATALTFLCQNFAWAVCADGSTFPVNPNGFVFGQGLAAANWSPGQYTFPAGSIFVPDNSVFEHNDPAQPLTGGGHNWVFDQGSALCKQIDTGPAGGTPTAWAFPTSTATDCIVLQSITGSSGNPPVPIFGPGFSIPYQGDAVTPTCDPTQYVGGNPRVGPALPTNTYFNHLGCSISHGAATTPQTADTYLFVAGFSSGLWVVPLTNVTNPVVGGLAGKVVGALDWFGNIPLGQRLTNATVSPDGQFAMATSISRLPAVFACLNPLGDPTGTNPVTGVQSFPITGAINPNFTIARANTVPCMQVGSNGLTVDETTTFGPDNQPYFGGNPAVTTFNASPGGSATTAWPQCLFNGFGFKNPAPTTLMGKLAEVFNAKSANHCGAAQFNGGFLVAPITQPPAMIRHGQYMYASMTSTSPFVPPGDVVVQFKVTVDPVSGLSQYRGRSYLIGFPRITGLGIADDLKSLMVLGDANQFDPNSVIAKLPLCEDLP